MRQVVLNAFGGTDVLELADVATPAPPRDGYLVEVRAAGINYADVVERRGRYAREMPLPYLLGKEASGTVVARGPDAAAYAVGDPVVVVEMADNGCYADCVAVREHHVLPARPGLDFEQLAAYPIAFATAWYALVEAARLRAGESILIHAAAGGVGVATVQLARALGLSPIIGTASGEDKCAWAVAHGADACIDSVTHRGEAFERRVRELAGERGVDGVLDSVGGEGFEQSMRLAAPLGRVIAMGFASIEEGFAERMRRVHPLALFHRSLTVCGLNLARLDFPTRRHTWQALNRFMEQHGLTMPIGARFALSDVAQAHAALEGRGTRGKLLLVP